MTQLLERALSDVRKLPQPEQDAIAALIFEELADEKLLDEAFSRSQNQLAELAAKVREDIRAGLARDTGVDGSWHCCKHLMTQRCAAPTRGRFEINA